MDYRNRKTSDGINRIQPAGKRQMVGLGFIIANTTQSLAEYKRYCFDTSTVTIVTTENEIINQCLIGKNAISQIEFPNTTKQKGSLVAWICPKANNTPVIIDVINGTTDKNNQQSDETVYFKKGGKYDINSILFEALGNKGVFNIIANGYGENNGEIITKVIHSKLQGLYDLYVQGNIKIDSEDSIIIKAKQNFEILIEDDIDDGTGIKKTKKANLSYKTGRGLQYLDENDNFIQTTKDGIDLRVNKDKVIKLYSAQNEQQYTVLSDNLINTLNSAFDAVTNLCSTLMKSTDVQGYAFNPATISEISKINFTLKSAKKSINKIKAKNVKIS